jgi:hypothetical protein
MFILLALINTQTGWDIQTSGGMIWLFGVIVWPFSVMGFFRLPFATTEGLRFFTGPFIQNHAFALIVSMFVLGYAINQLIKDRIYK